MTRCSLATVGLAEEVRLLREKRERGDLTDKRFAGAVTDTIVTAWRREVQRRLDPGESIVAEHHVSRGHLKLSRSVLREPDEEALSLFLTERRLYCVRATVPAEPGAPMVASLDDLRLDDVRALRRRRQVRTSEIAAGAAVVIVAIALGPVLLITGKLLLALGVLGILHGLLLPTRWIEIQVAGDALLPPPEILVLRKKSARRIVERLQRHLDGPRPAVAEPRAQDEPPPAALRREEGAPTRVLIIDDESDYRETLVKVLGRRGLEATAVGDGEQGLRYLGDNPVDVVVVDLKMPVMDGLEVLRRIEQQRPELPAILLTGHGTTAAGLEALREGAFDFLLKPISPERLVLEIEAAVQKSRARQEAAEPQGTEG